MKRQQSNFNLSSQAIQTDRGKCWKCPHKTIWQHFAWACWCVSVCVFGEWRTFSSWEIFLHFFVPFRLDFVVICFCRCAALIQFHSTKRSTHRDSAKSFAKKKVNINWRLWVSHTSTHQPASQPTNPNTPLTRSMMTESESNIKYKLHLYKTNRKF